MYNLLAARENSERSGGPVASVVSDKGCVYVCSVMKNPFKLHVNRPYKTTRLAYARDNS